MNPIRKLDFTKLDLRRYLPAGLTGANRIPPAKAVGLAFERGTIEGVLARRTNGAIEVENAFVTDLSLDPLTDDPVLVGREIRKKLDAAQIRERRCTVCIPASWLLTLTVKLPELPEADLQSLLQLEAERGFPYSPDTLVLAHSRYSTPNGDRYALLVAVPREHINRLESALAAAQLRPVSFSIGITALNQAALQNADGMLALLPTQTALNLQISFGGGLVALRTIDLPAGPETGEARFDPQDIMREIRVTLGQLEPEVQNAIRQARVFGQNDNADELLEVVEPHLTRLGLKVDHVKHLPAQTFGTTVEHEMPVSQAAALAILHLTGTPPLLEFLPPRLSAWQRFAARYSSRKLARVGLVLSAVGLIVATAFLIQQVQIVYWTKKWDSIKTAAAELDLMQRQIKKFRPWYDESFRSLSVLRRLAEAFPEDGTVSAKTVELRQPATVTCSGTARDNGALLRTLDKLRTAKDVANVHLEQTRGGSPLQFTFNFQWIEHTSQ